MIVAPATWKAPVVDATPTAPHVRVKRIVTIPVICRLHVVNGSLAQLDSALLERVVMLARPQDSGGRGFKSRRSHYSQSTQRIQYARN